MLDTMPAAVATLAFEATQAEKRRKDEAENAAELEAMGRLCEASEAMMALRPDELRRFVPQMAGYLAGWFFPPERGTKDLEEVGEAMLQIPWVSRMAESYGDDLAMGE